jgi:hypothetical protein
MVVPDKTKSKKRLFFSMEEVSPKLKVRFLLRHENPHFNTINLHEEYIRGLLKAIKKENFMTEVSS